jgi:hypothetical protein
METHATVCRFVVLVMLILLLNSCGATYLIDPFKFVQDVNGEEVPHTVGTTSENLSLVFGVRNLSTNVASKDIDVWFTYSQMVLGSDTHSGTTAAPCDPNLIITEGNGSKVDKTYNDCQQSANYHVYISTGPVLPGSLWKSTPIPIGDPNAKECKEQNYCRPCVVDMQCAGQVEIRFDNNTSDENGSTYLLHQTQVLTWGKTD